jgi:hypothetical protein
MEYNCCPGTFTRTNQASASVGLSESGALVTATGAFRFSALHTVCYGEASADGGRDSIDA